MVTESATEIERMKRQRDDLLHALENLCYSGYKKWNNAIATLVKVKDEIKEHDRL